MPFQFLLVNRKACFERKNVMLTVGHEELSGLRPEPTLIDRAYEAILEAIRDGRLAPGLRLNQDELAARLQISRQPVGQALTILKSQGFVRDNGRRGLIVAPLEREFLRSIYQLREALDSLAARLAAERCAPADALEGKRLIAAGRKADRAGELGPLIDADLKFHFWIYQLAGNPLLAQTMNLYWTHLQRAMGDILRSPSSRAVVWDEHAAIVKAISEGDAKSAASLALQHTRGAAERVAGASEPLGAEAREPAGKMHRSR
jgi:DNA-binding GntR family transcriptional regulator